MIGRVESRFGVTGRPETAAGRPKTAGGNTANGADFERALSGAMAAPGDTASLKNLLSGGAAPVERQILDLMRSMMNAMLKGPDDGLEGAIIPSTLSFPSGGHFFAGIEAAGDRATGIAANAWPKTRLVSDPQAGNEAVSDADYSHSDYSQNPRAEEADALTQKTAQASNNLHLGRDFERIIESAANKYGVDADLVRAVIQTESGGNPRAVSQAGAEGLMQLMPETAAELGVKNPFDPTENINGGTQYLSRLLARYRGDTKMALAAYNWGMGNLERSPHRMPPETRNYVKRVQGLYDSPNG